MTVTDLTALAVALPTVISATWFGLRRISKEIEQRGYERARAETYKEESEETIAQLTSELTAKDERIAELDDRLSHATTVEIPRLIRRVDELSEIILNLSRGREHEPC